ncbi:hypothetical protein, partial [Geitlerinema sp. PCC 9228]|uniref:hypothetical protein n=1 Tax=Geitlerinema sp. PCC 9228 TaxID=111611 RepID=UPI00147D6E54
QLRQEVTSLQQQLQQYQQVAQQNQQLRQLIKKLQHNSEDWEYVGSPSQKPRWTQQKIREMEERIDQRNSGED